MKRKYKEWLLFASFIVVAAVCYALISANSSRQLYNNNSDESVTLDKGWTLACDGNIIDNYMFSTGRIPLANKGDELMFITQLPDKLPNNPVLVFRTVHSDIAVYIDGEEIYSYGQEAYDMGRYVSSGTHYIDMQSNYAGKIISVVLRVSENHAFSTLRTPYISNSNYMHRDFLMKHKVELFCIVFLTVLGLLGLLIAFIELLQNKDLRTLGGIAAFSFFIGLWSLCTTELIGYFTYNMQARNIIEYASLYITPFIAFSYFGYDLNKESKTRQLVYKIIYYTTMIFFLASCLLHAVNLVHFPSLLFLCHILIVVVITYVIVFNVYDAIHGKTISKVLLAGFMVLVLFVSMDLINFNIRKYSKISQNDYYSSMIYIGVLCFVIALLYDYLGRTLKDAFKKVELETLAKIAYTDVLTGLANRRRCDDVLDFIMNEGLPYSIICFDLNNLKKVNDTQGHQQGDVYICEFARVLRDTFEVDAVKQIAGDVIIARQGGDEFVALLYGQDLTLEYIDELIGTMNSSIDDVNSKHEGWNMSTAYGIAISSERNFESAKQAIKLADERLYDKKREMHRAQ